MLEPTLVANGDLSALIAAMESSGTGGPQVQFLTRESPPPYTRAGDGSKPVDVQLLGGSPARWVGVAMSGSVTPGKFIVSDSFSPCVPVVAFESDSCSLAHCYGIGGIDTYSRDWRKSNAVIILVIKGLHAQQRQVALELLNKLKGFRVQGCVLKTAAMLGVIVRGNTILAYIQGASNPPASRA